MMSELFLGILTSLMFPRFAGLIMHTTYLPCTVSLTTVLAGRGSELDCLRA